MRIGLVAYGLGRPLQGIGRYTAELAAALAGVGVDVVPLWAGRRARGDKGLSLPGSRLLPGLLSLGQAEIAWHAHRQGLDLVHDPTGCAPLGLTRSRRVTTIHDAIPYVLPETCTKLDRLIYRCWLPLITPSLDAIVTVSETSRSDICRHLPVRAGDVVVVANAAGRRFRLLDEGSVKPALAKYHVERPYVLAMGSASPRKNVGGLLEAFALLRRWTGRRQLVVGGARPAGSSSLLKTAERLELGDSVHFAGCVDDQDLPALYSGADLFVFPSLYEGFGLPVLEAMACGTPVVTSNSSSLPEVAGDAALLVDATDPEQIALAMLRALSEAGLSAELRERGLARSALFSWERTARATVEVYERLLQPGHTRPATRP